MALWHDFSEYYSFPCQFSSHQLLHIHYSSYQQHYTVSILTASLNEQVKLKTTSSVVQELCSSVSATFNNGNVLLINRHTTEATAYNKTETPCLNSLFQWYSAHCLPFQFFETAIVSGISSPLLNLLAELV
jgi:hypothetical protein